MSWKLLILPYGFAASSFETQKKPPGDPSLYARPRIFYKEGKRGSGSVIRFDPEDKTGGLNEEGSNKRPPFVGLAYELGHAEAYDNATHSPVKKRVKGDGNWGPIPP